MKGLRTKPKGLGITLVIGIALVLLVMSVLSPVETLTLAVGINSLHFDPDESSTSCGQSVEVVLVADIDEQNPVIATKTLFTFDKNCLEMINVVGNTADWPGGVTMQDLGWINENGSILITTNMGLNPGLTGSVPIATITLRGKNCAGCTSSLHLSQGEYTTSSMETIYPELDDGTFATVATGTPTPTATPTTIPTLTPTPTPSPTPTITPTHIWIFQAAGCFPKHLPDTYTGQITLTDIELLTIPDEVQGVYWWNGNEWLFWAPSAPGCTLSMLGGGHTFDYLVCVTGPCDWNIPLP
jgi:hypothetical protein